MIEYRSVGWKYTLLSPFLQELPEAVGRYVDSPMLPEPFLQVVSEVYGKKGDRVGFTLRIGEGYSWDGASGPTVDTDGTMRAALVHDALYQCMRIGALNRCHRAKVDRVFRRHLKEDGVNVVRRWLWFRAVRWFGKKSAAQPQADA